MVGDRLKLTTGATVGVKLSPENRITPGDAAFLALALCEKLKQTPPEVRAAVANQVVVAANAEGEYTLVVSSGQGARWYTLWSPKNMLGTGRKTQSRIGL